MPVLGAIVADQYLGRIRTIIYSSLFYMLGLATLCFTSLPLVNESESGIFPSLLGLIVAMILIAIGTGGLKPNTLSLVAEQYTGSKKTLRILDNGEKVIVDPGLTTQR